MEKVKHVGGKLRVNIKSCCLQFLVAIVNSAIIGARMAFSQQLGVGSVISTNRSFLQVRLICFGVHFIKRTETIERRT